MKNTHKEITLAIDKISGLHTDVESIYNSMTPYSIPNNPHALRCIRPICATTIATQKLIRPKHLQQLRTHCRDIVSFDTYAKLL